MRALFHVFSCFDFFCEGSLRSGRSKATCVTVGRDTDQSFRVRKINLSTLKVAITNPTTTQVESGRKNPVRTRCFDHEDMKTFCLRYSTKISYSKSQSVKIKGRQERPSIRLCRNLPRVTKF